MKNIVVVPTWLNIIHNQAFPDVEPGVPLQADLVWDHRDPAWVQIVTSELAPTALAAIPIPSGAFPAPEQYSDIVGNIGYARGFIAWFAYLYFDGRFFQFSIPIKDVEWLEIGIAATIGNDYRLWPPSWIDLFIEQARRAA